MGTQRKDGLEKLNCNPTFTATGIVGRDSSDPYDIASVNQIRVLCENVGGSSAVDVYGRIRKQTAWTNLGTIAGTSASTIDTSLIDEIYFDCSTYSASGGTPRLVASGFFNRAAGGGGGGGEANTASNLGAGSGVYASKSGVDLRFKSLVAGTNVTISSTSTEITINSSGGGGGISSINTLTASSQTLATGTAGTDFAIASGTSTHTFNLPTASGTNTGKLSSTDWTTFNNKVATTRSISTTSPLSGGGDLSANRTLAVGGLSSLGTANQIPGTNSGATAWEYKTLTNGTAISITHGAGTITIATTAMTSLNTLTAASQTFATGTSGTDFGISSATSTHTFNLPTASGSNRGALSSADWTTFNSKVGTARTISTTSPLTGGGDLSADRTFALGGLSGMGTANYVVGTNAGATGWEYKQLIAGTNVTITHAANSVTIAASGGGGGGTGLASSGDTSKTSAYTIVAGDTGKVIFVDSTSAAFTLTLPTPSAGYNFIIKDKAGLLSTNNVTLARAASEKIENVAASYIMQADFGSWRVYCNGTDWFFV